MDWIVSSAIATVVAFSDGSASVYFSSGGGLLGGQAHEPIRNAARQPSPLRQSFSLRCN